MCTVLVCGEEKWSMDKHWVEWPSQNSQSRIPLSVDMNEEKNNDYN